MKTFVYLALIASSASAIRLSNKEIKPTGLEDIVKEKKVGKEFIDDKLTGLEKDQMLETGAEDFIKEKKVGKELIDDKLTGLEKDKMLKTGLMEKELMKEGVGSHHVDKTDHETGFEKKDFIEGGTVGTEHKEDKESGLELEGEDVEAIMFINPDEKSGIEGMRRFDQISGSNLDRFNRLGSENLKDFDKMESGDFKRFDQTSDIEGGMDETKSGMDTRDDGLSRLGTIDSDVTFLSKEVIVPMVELDAENLEFDKPKGAY